MKLRKILVGTDFSPESEVALEHAVGIARHVKGEVILAHAGTTIDTADAALAPESAALIEYERIVSEHAAANRAQLGQLVERVRGRGVAASEREMDGFPDTSLSETADQLDVDLVVIGTHGRTGIKRLLLGSVAERVVRLCRRHVMVARPRGAGAEGYRRILVPTDFSPRADHALEIALDLLAEGGEIELLHAWSLPALTGSLVPSAISEKALAPVRSSFEVGARAKAEAVVARLGRPRARIECTIVNDSPAHAIDQRAQDGHDLIVIGGHGRRGLRRLILGSVAEATVRHAPCSVIVAHERTAIAGDDGRPPTA
ncbi:MAG TPA: universal stress protein [Kofleriaceae bacterium]|nr:universal stress protein [Kofleriaceae bacterium]